MNLDIDGLAPFLSESVIQQMKAETQQAADLLHAGKGPGAEFTGWLTLPENYDKEEFQRIKEVGARLRHKSDAVVVIGIGGSYLGAKAAFEFLSSPFHNQLANSGRPGPAVYFAGINLSADYHLSLMDVLEGKDWSLVIISKSGTTTEPAIAFRFFKAQLEKKYDDASSRIIAITDKSKGALRQLADEKGYESFVVPDDVGGRFSVLTPVGLLPLAIAGVNVDELMQGAAQAGQDFLAPYESNPALQYAALRNILYRQGKTTEIMVSFEPRFTFLIEWWKQLYGESEGKEGKGIYPSSAIFTADLHSLGQYIQEGRRSIFETALAIAESDAQLYVPENEANLDGLNYLAGKSLHYVNNQAMEGTRQAHVAGQVPNIRITIPKANAFHLGYLFFFFEKACAVSGYILGVNPFDQPGVEAYKKNMFKLLGKPT